MNRVAQANDALWALVQATFPPEWAPTRNPTGPQQPKPRANGGLAYYVDQLDDMAPETLRAFAGAGGLFDLKISPHVTVVLLGGTEDARRTAAWAAIEQLKVAPPADPSVGGSVEYARLEAAEDASADRLEWMAGGLRVPVQMLFNAPSEAG